MGFPTLSLKKSVFIDAPREMVWDYLGDTDHMNRVIRLPSVEVKDGRVKAKLFGIIPLEWEEHPFEWTRPEGYSVVREFPNGPLSKYQFGIDLFEEGKGTRVQIFAKLTLRYAILLPLAYFIGVKALQTIAQYAKRIERRNRKADPERPRAGRITHNSEKLYQLLSKLEMIPRLNKGSLYRLGDLLRKGTDDEVTGMQPLKMAQLWGESAESMTTLFLNAAEQGLLQLDWVLLCSYCRVEKVSARSLSELPSNFHCDLCGIDFKADLSENTELRFSASEQIRTLSRATYCIGAPLRTPHILCQRVLEPKDKVTVLVNLPKEAVRIRTLGTNAVVPLENHRPGPNQVAMANDSPVRATCVVEKIARDPYSLLASNVLLKTKFRRLFGPEVVSADLNMGIRHMAVMFTDVRGSTALYEQLGDAPALQRIRKHFAFLSEKINGCSGTILKTMGDSVMAVFPLETQAVEAALQIQEGLAEFNRANKFSPALCLKIGIHLGPALLVEANDDVDYFGQTINIAARLHQACGQGEIILSGEMMGIPEVKTLVYRRAGRIQEASLQLRGLAKETGIYRVSLGEVMAEAV